MLRNLFEYIINHNCQHISMNWCKNVIYELLIHCPRHQFYVLCNISGHTAIEPSIPKAGNCLGRKSLFAGNNWCYSSTMKTPVAKTHPWWWLCFKAMKKVNASMLFSWNINLLQSIIPLINKSRDKTWDTFSLNFVWANVDHITDEFMHPQVSMRKKAMSKNHLVWLINGQIWSI